MGEKKQSRNCQKNIYITFDKIWRVKNKIANKTFILPLTNFEEYIKKMVNCLEKEVV